ncbi:hypothetical protein DFH08DRAFT_703817 [Mycena albidolilacea]|uniref:Uncharacterized protein n=1 Tax=Mycena albidolilacea TaxID=1033008 RepID=A0AAD6ZVR4_9AGAR|nr:hypothetical protein DFH08DRAFT_703817 [Mycena albidolilacea]
MKTIQAVSAPRIHQAPSQPRAPLTMEEKKEKRETSKEKQAAIDSAVAEFFSYTESKAIKLGERFDRKPHYFLDLFFQGGARMVNHHDKINPCNAFKSEKAAERREEGASGLKAQELHEEYKEEYEALTPEEKEALVERYVIFAQTKDEVSKARRDTPRARIRDVLNTVHNIQMLMHGLKFRVGIEGYFCIVRNTPDFYMIPQWYFTSAELERYMPLAVRHKWDTGEVGCRLEAFAIAGCDTMNLLRTNKSKVSFLKGDIRDRVHEGLGALSLV